MNGSNIEDDDGMEPTIYKQKYERAMKELEYLKQRLQQQHEDDLEQLMALKKQLEKKVFFLFHVSKIYLGPKCMVLCYIKKKAKMRYFEHGRNRTCNLLFRRQTRYPLRHAPNCTND